MFLINKSCQGAMPIHLGTDPRNHTRSLDNFHYPSKDLNNETVLLDGANPEFSFTVRSAGSFDDRAPG